MQRPSMHNSRCAVPHVCMLPLYADLTKTEKNVSSLKGCRFSTLNCPIRSVMSPLAGVPVAHHLHGGLGVGATQNQRQTSESF